MRSGRRAPPERAMRAAVARSAARDAFLEAEPATHLVLEEQVCVVASLRESYREQSIGYVLIDRVALAQCERRPRFRVDSGSHQSGKMLAGGRAGKAPG